MHYRIYFPVLLFLLTSCARQISLKDDPVWMHKEFEARHFDVPLLLQAMPTSEIPECSEQGSRASYYTDISMLEVAAYYQEHMERSGWDLLFEVHGSYEILLTFKKPTQYATVSIRKERNGTKLVLFVAQK